MGSTATAESVRRGAQTETPLAFWATSDKLSEQGSLWEAFCQVRGWMLELLLWPVQYADFSTGSVTDHNPLVLTQRNNEFLVSGVNWDQLYSIWCKSRLSKVRIKPSAIQAKSKPKIIYLLSVKKLIRKKGNNSFLKKKPKAGDLSVSSRQLYHFIKQIFMMIPKAWQ